MRLTFSPAGACRVCDPSIRPAPLPWPEGTASGFFPSTRQARNRWFGMPRRFRRPIPDGRVRRGSSCHVRPCAEVSEPSSRDSISANARRGILDRGADARNIPEPARPCGTSEARCRDGREGRGGEESSEILVNEDTCGPPSPVSCSWQLFAACFGNGQAATCCRSWLGSRGRAVRRRPEAVLRPAARASVRQISNRHAAGSVREPEAECQGPDGGGRLEPGHGQVGGAKVLRRSRRGG